MNTNFNSIDTSNVAGGSYGIGKFISFYQPSEKSLKFKQLAESRMSATLKAFQLVSNLSNKNNYNYTDEQAQKIISAIEVEVENLKLKFVNSNKKSL